MIELWKGQPTDWHMTLALEPEEPFLSVMPLPSKDGVGFSVNAGASHKLDGKRARRAAAKAVKTARVMKAGAVTLDVTMPLEILGRQGLALMAEGAALALFQPDCYKSGLREGPPPKVYLSGAGDSMGDVVAEAAVLARAVFYARRLVNAPANLLTPASMATRMVEAAAAQGIDGEILDESQLEDLGMQAMLAVGASAAHPPRLIVLRYQGNPGSHESVALVGKGVTCDTGGYNLKPSSSMRGIRGDMAGAAAVCGCLLALAEQKVPVNAVAVIPAAENRIAPGSYLAGDLVGSMAGKTIEIGNTDAEGRLLLADGITFALRREKATWVVDIATLTGGVVKMFGFTTAGLMTNDEDFYSQLCAAAHWSGEQYWRLPDFPEYREMIDSPVADLCNTAEGCSTIAGGLFVREFAGEVPWLHLDIAGTAWTDPPKWEFQSKGATGAGVTTLYHLCKQLSQSLKG